MPDNLQFGPLTIPFSPACERNKDAILEALSPYLCDAASILEIGSGTAQHAVHFAGECPNITWQTSDQTQYLEGIKAQLSNAKSSNVGLQNLLPPFSLDVNQSQWLPEPNTYDMIYTANTLHIMIWDDVQAFFKGLPQVCHGQSLLCIYGPFKYAEQFTSHSNFDFDQSLRANGRGSAIRDFEAVNELAFDQGFRLIKDVNMPANNQCLFWQRALNST